MSAIPPAKQAAVRKALQATFGVTAPESLTLVRGGLSSALVCRAVVRGRPWLLRVETARDAVRDPARQYACMMTAAQAGLAPRVRYAHAATGVAILDFVDARPLSTYPGGGAAIAGELAGLVARLQATPAFPAALDHFEAIDSLAAAVRASGVLAPEAAAAPFAAYGEVRDLYRRLTPLRRVSSHNDLNPANVLYDGARLWLIDWETAFGADPHVDPATLAYWYGLEGEAETALLIRVFGRADEAVRARHLLMLQVCRVFYATMMLLHVAGSRPPGAPPIADLSAPSLAEVREKLRAGAITVGEPAGQLMLAKASLNAALEAVRTPAFAELGRRLAA
jgi:aminoglycoside phosphotransferase (APT) family kinase protein